MDKFRHGDKIFAMTNSYFYSIMKNDMKR